MKPLSEPAMKQVKAAVRFWRLPASLLLAIIAAEGGERAFLRAIQISVPSCKSFSKALEIGCRTVVHALIDFAQSEGHRREDFLKLLARRWAPVGATNDPTNLNANWEENVMSLWKAQDDPT